MKEFRNTVQLVFTVISDWLNGFLGGYDNLLYALLILIAADYLAGVMCAIVNTKISDEISLKGIFRKILIFILVGTANIMDVQVIGIGSVLRTAVIFFYLSIEGVSLLEHAANLGLQCPTKLKTVFQQLYVPENSKGGNGGDG